MAKVGFRWLGVTLAVALLWGFCLAVVNAQESIYAAASVALPPLSTGFEALSGEIRMVKHGQVGEEAVFDPDEIAHVLGLSTVRAITVTALPPLTDGELRLGSTRVRAGQTIPRGELDRLSFVPAGYAVRRSAFLFHTDCGGHVIRCEIHFSPGV